MPIHESLAIGKWVAETYPDANLWPLNRLDRARARAVCSEMASGFAHLRAELSCHLFARVPRYEIRLETRAVARAAPRLAPYDDYVRELGGDPDAALLAS